jgi:WD40 repeat protein
LAFAGEFGLVKVWDVHDGVITKLNRIGDPNEKRINAVAFSPDGETLFTGDEEGVIKTWGVQSGEKIKVDFKTENPIYTLAVSPDGNTLAYAGSGRNVNLINAHRLVESKGFLFTRDPRADVLSIAWSPDSTNILAGSRDGAIRVYEVNSREVLFSMKEHEGSVNSVAWSPDGRWLASGGEDNRGDNDKTLILWDWVSRESIPLVDHTEDVFGVAFSPDGKILAAGSRDGTLTLYEVETRRKIAQRSDHSDEISSVAFNTQGIPVLVSGSLDQKVKLYEIATQQPLGNLFSDGKGSLKSLEFLSNQKLLMLGSQSNDSKLWQAQIKDMENMGEEELFSTSGIPTAAAINVDGNKLVLGYENSTIDIWEAQPDGTFTESENLDLGAGPIYSLAIDVNDNTLAAGLCSRSIELDEECEIQLWSIPSKTLLDTLEGSTGKVTSLAFSPKDPLLASGTQDQKIMLWLQEDGNGYELNTELQYSSGSGFSSLAFDSEGSFLAAGNNIGEVLMLDVNTLSLYGDAFTGASGAVTSLAFSPDSLILASGSQTGTVILWDLNLDLWKIRACDLAKRNLSEEEWRIYVKLPEYQATCTQWPDG